MKKKIFIHVDETVHDKFMFKLYRLHEQTGKKITKSALIEALMKSYLEIDDVNICDRES